MECGCLGRWRPAKRVTSRREQLSRCGSQCFLDPNPERPRYPVCPPDSCRPTCEGLLAARRRAITQRDYGIERKAIAQARLMRCSWASGAVAKRGRGRKRARRAA